MHIRFIKYDLFRIAFSLFFVSVTSYVLAQPVGSEKTSVNEILGKIKDLRSKFPAEKLYLHLDKPDYNVGDTIWFKCYLFDAAFLSPSKQSGVQYIELADDRNKVLRRMMVPVKSGLSWGNIPLDEKEMPEGGYTLRAYTKWMLNFGEDCIYSRHFNVRSPGKSPWLVNTESRFKSENMSLALLFRTIDKQALGFEEMRLQILNGKKVLYNQKMQTTADGRLDINFTLPQNLTTSNEKMPPNDLLLTADELSESVGRPKIIIPLLLNRPENTDLQFMPEGGHMVAGLAANIAFKAIGENGKGVPIEGWIYDSKGNKITSFKSYHNGMGTFNLLPQTGESYQAKITLPGGTIKTYPLPPLQPSGTSIRIINTAEQDSVQIILAGTNDKMRAAKDFYLIGQSRGVVCYASVVSPDENGNKIKVSKMLFPSGIARFTLMTPEKQALNERMVFIDHHDNLNLNLITEKPTDTSGDSIALNITVKDSAGKPVQGSFSLSVTDDSLVTTDSLQRISIVTSLLLSSDLKGFVEDPGYYLENLNPQRFQALDNLLLTQGWVGYEWPKVFGSHTPFIEADTEFTVRGRVLTGFNKSIGNAKVTLLSKKPVFFMETRSDKDGYFVFKDFPHLDTATFIIQAFNRNGKSFNIGVTVEEFKPPLFTTTERTTLPWYVNSDSILVENVKSQLERPRAEEKLTGEHVLNEVTITAKKIIKGSNNLNGFGEADQVLDEKDMEKAGKVTLLNLLEKQIKGFHTGSFSRTPAPPLKTYFINDRKVKLIMDGVDVDFFYQSNTTLEGSEHYEYLKRFFDYYTAEDIKGIEVMYTPRYQANYNRRFLDTKESFIITGNFKKGSDYAYLEITTQTGEGSFMKVTAGTYQYKPIPFSYPKEFYRPRYPVDGTAVAAVRPTIHWEPNLITDASGHCVVSFYAAKGPGTYTVIVEGSDLNGNVGSKKSSIIIGK